MFCIGMVFGIPSTDFEPPLYFCYSLFVIICNLLIVSPLFFNCVLIYFRLVRFSADAVDVCVVEKASSLRVQVSQ